MSIDLSAALQRKAYLEPDSDGDVTVASGLARILPAYDCRCAVREPKWIRPGAGTLRRRARRVGRAGLAQEEESTGARCVTKQYSITK
jgi:hypothetical protein